MSLLDSKFDHLHAKKQLLSQCAPAENMKSQAY